MKGFVKNFVIHLENVDPELLDQFEKIALKVPGIDSREFPPILRFNFRDPNLIITFDPFGDSSKCSVEEKQLIKESLTLISQLFE